MEAPDVISLLGNKVAIKKRSIILVDNAAAYGTYIQERTEIQVRSNMSPSAERNTVLHEMLHAILMEYELDSEEVVRVLTPALLAALRDNPHLIDYLTA